MSPVWTLYSNNETTAYKPKSVNFVDRVSERITRTVCSICLEERRLQDERGRDTGPVVESKDGRRRVPVVTAAHVSATVIGLCTQCHSLDFENVVRNGGAFRETRQTEQVVVCGEEAGVLK